MRRTSRFVGIALAAITVGTLASAAVSAPANIIYGTNGHDTIVATPAADVIYAKSGNDKISGVGDGDVVWASSGNDKITTQPGVTVTNVLIEGNVGHDSIQSTGGLIDDSSINGGSGNDVISITGCGNDVYGESGNDKYTNSQSCLANPNTASLGNGHDEVDLRFASLVHLGNGNDRLKTISPGTVIAGSGNDRIEIVLGGNANIDLGVGHDFLDLENTANVTAYGSNGRDRVLIGHANGTILNTGDGDDRIEVDDSTNNALDGGPGRSDKVVIDTDSSATCTRVERVVDWGGHAATCS